MKLPIILKRKKSFSSELKSEYKLLREIFNLKPTKVFFSVLIALVVGPLLLFIILKPSTANNIFYGVTFSKKYAEQLGLNWQESYLKILDDLQVKNIRLVAYWNDIENTQNNFDFNDISWQLNEAEKRNLNVILTLGRKVPRYPECFEPQWWKELPNSKEKNARVLKYVQSTVLALKKYNSIKMWQVENEPFFPFGVCDETKREVVEKEVEIVKSLDPRPVLIQDSGEGGFWFPSYRLGTYLGISMYRRIWYDFWHVFFGRFIYFKYPLSHWTYKIKADLVGVPIERIIVTELQAEPWGPEDNSKLSQEEKDQSMSKNDFLETISYAQKTGFRHFYFWGVEWWLFEKEKNNNSYFWDVSKALFKTSN